MIEQFESYMEGQEGDDPLDGKIIGVIVSF
jgi:hypothetical protein